MAVALGIFTLIHLLFYLILTFSWRAIPSSKTDTSKAPLKCSIVIAARNEEKNLPTLTEDLEKQDYPKHLFEIIVVNDFSEDQTLQILSDWEAKSGLNIKVLTLTDSAKQGKKHALSYGIAQARNEIILTTDCDCRLPESWISSFTAAFGDSTQIVAGGVALEGEGQFARMQQAEFAGLVAFGAVTLTANNPSICSGANLAFRKQAFEKVGGYQSNIHLPSGDDEFLLYDILKAFPKSGVFLKNKASIVSSKTHVELKKFLNQRLRWASKWKYNKNLRLRAIAILFFIEYVLFIIGWISAIVSQIPIELMVLISLLRYFAQGILVSQVRKFLGYKNLALPLVLVQIIYPFHILFIGALSIFDRYTWKGRSY